VGDLKREAVRMIYANPRVGRVFRKIYYRMR
jgi:hypothetical protein